MFQQQEKLNMCVLVILEFPRDSHIRAYASPWDDTFIYFECKTW